MVKNLKKNISVISTVGWVPSDFNKNNEKIKTYKILINDLILDAFIGIHDFEKIKKQKISISSSINVFDTISNITHKIENFVSYEHIVNDIKSLLSKGHIDLLETLGEKIADLCFEDKRILTVNIKLEKLEVFKDVNSVGIEVFRKRPTSKVVEEKNKASKIKE